MSSAKFPFVCQGLVVHGYGRGSSKLANLDRDCVKNIIENGPSQPGIYYGWARLFPAEKHYPMVMSSGWNPFFENKERSVEVHLIDVLLEPFYGSTLRIVISGYIRPEKKFLTMEDLVQAITDDIGYARQHLSSNQDHRLLYP